jgi:hypothetical protein
VKKAARKLALNRDTLLTLSVPPVHVAGGITVPFCVVGSVPCSINTTIFQSVNCITIGCPTRVSDCTALC